MKWIINEKKGYENIPKSEIGETLKRYYYNNGDEPIDIELKDGITVSGILIEPGNNFTHLKREGIQLWEDIHYENIKSMDIPDYEIKDRDGHDHSEEWED